MIASQVAAYLDWLLPALLVAVGFGGLMRARTGEPGATSLRMLAAVVVILAVNALLWDQLRPDAGWIAPPGSIVTRVRLPQVDAVFRRAVEPAVMLLLVLTAIAAPRSYTPLLLLLSLLLTVESALRTPGLMQHGSPAPVVTALPRILGIIIALLYLRALLVGSSGSSRGAGRRALVLGISAALPLSITAALHTFTGAPPVRIGAHYYSWFPENWVGSYSGRQMVPPVLPELGEYRSDDPAVVRRHVEWARSGGIDFLVLDWWPRRRELKQKVMAVADQLVAEQMPFAVHFETLDIAGPKEGPEPGEPANVLLMNETRTELLCTHLRYMSERLLTKPGYLRIEGRPAIFFYSTRHLVGPVAAAFGRARRCVADAIGEEPYFIGDEVFFNVLDHDRNRGFFMRGEGEPVWSRIHGFDAITAYNPFDPNRPHHGGTGGVERFLRDVQGLYSDYAAVAASAAVRFVPTVIPGYNDRGIRPELGHPIIPRFPRDGGPSFLARALERWGMPFLGGDGILIITSFNEWNEGSQIEPTAPSPRTAEDLSGTGKFSGGEELEGYGTSALATVAALKGHGAATAPR